MTYRELKARLKAMLSGGCGNDEIEMIDAMLVEKLENRFGEERILKALVKREQLIEANCEKYGFQKTTESAVIANSY